MLWRAPSHEGCSQERLAMGWSWRDRGLTMRRGTCSVEGEAVTIPSSAVKYEMHGQ